MVRETRPVGDAGAGAGIAPLRPLLEPGDTVWRLEHAPRAAVLVDAAAYYGALRRAMVAARHAITIVGWDVDSRTRLVGEDGRADDGLPATLGPLLGALVRRRPGLRVRVLLWDYSLLYALEREFVHAIGLQWATSRHVDVCLDDVLPTGSAQHQKIVVIDDRVAFAGGIDLTIRRWDTPRHLPGDPRRVDPAGVAYRPFHDVQMAVDGGAARALGDLVRRRWAEAASEALPPAPGDGPDPWPEGLRPDFTDVRVGIARTVPGLGPEPAVDEVDRLYGAMIARAERTIWIENQFLTAASVAERIVARMREVPELEAVFVCPRTHHTWIEHRTMLAGRIRFAETFRAAGLADRVRLVHPSVGEGEAREEVMVHAKVAIVDDTVLRVGSANLCNRSLGADSECDLVVEATTPAERAAVRAVRDRLAGEHCGVAPEAFAAALAETGSLVAALERCSGPARGLVPVDDDPSRAEDPPAGIEAIADPPRPILPADYLADFDGGRTKPRRLRRWLLAAAVLLAVVALVTAWKATPLSTFAHPDRVAEVLTRFDDGAWGLPLTVGIFVVAGFVVFPVTVLIGATAAAFGLWPGILYAASGAMASALATYAVGRLAGSGALRRIMGPRINRIRQQVADNGILAVATIRMMPVAPFTFVNLVAGASRIRVVDYAIGTALGLAPGIAVMASLGDGILRVFREPTAAGLAQVALLVVGWIVLSFGFNALVRRLRARR